MDILTISHNILIVGGALIIILLIIISFILILILLKINYVLKDLKYKYNTAMNILFTPIGFINNLISKIIKNG